MHLLIYGQLGCTACKETIALAQNYGLQYVYETEATRKEISDLVGESINTVPQIFIVKNGFSEYIGSGMSALEDWIDEHYQNGHINSD